MRKFRLSRPAALLERKVDRDGSSFHKCEPFMARWQSIAEENQHAARSSACHAWMETPTCMLNPDAGQTFADSCVRYPRSCFYYCHTPPQVAKPGGTSSSNWRASPEGCSDCSGQAIEALYMAVLVSHCGDESASPQAFRQNRCEVTNSRTAESQRATTGISFLSRTAATAGSSVSRGALGTSGRTVGRSVPSGVSGIRQRTRLSDPDRSRVGTAHRIIIWWAVPTLRHVLVRSSKLQRKLCDTKPSSHWPCWEQSPARAGARGRS